VEGNNCFSELEALREKADEEEVVLMFFSP
jgi:hypothetical protein